MQQLARGSELLSCLRATKTAQFLYSDTWRRWSYKRQKNADVAAQGIHIKHEQLCGIREYTELCTSRLTIAVGGNGCERVGKLYHKDHLKYRTQCMDLVAFVHCMRSTNHDISNTHTQMRRHAEVRRYHAAMRIHGVTL